MGKVLEFPLLTADQIEVKVKKVTDKGAILLLYKTARVDMELLDAVLGPMNWQVDYREIKGNLYCGIGVTEDGEHWIWKWDCGIESRADGDGNEKKGEASDAFKRAGFKWGVGRELYTSPFTFAKVDTVESNNGRGYELKDKFARFSVAAIGYDGRTINKLIITDNKGKEVFSYGASRPSSSVAANSAQAAKEAGEAKLAEINAKLAAGKAENEAAGKAEKEAATCDRCGAVITGYISDKGKRYTAPEIVQMSQEKYGGTYCPKCMTALKAKRTESA